MAYRNNPSKAQAASQQPAKTSVAIDVFQNIVAVARSADGTMAGLAQWLLDHQAQAASLSISRFAQQAGVSETTVFRFCKRLGMAGFKDLRLALVEALGLAAGTQLARQGLDIDATHALASVLRSVIDVNSESLLKTVGLVSLDALQEAVTTLLGADHIHLVGFGSSAPVAFDAYQRFLCLGLVSSVHSDPHVLAAVIANARPGNVFLGISCSGRSRDLVECLESAAAQHVKSIVITSDRDSPAARAAATVLVSAVRRSPIAHETIGTRLSQLVIIEMLCIAMALQIPDRKRLAQCTVRLDQEIAKKRLPKAYVSQGRARAPKA